jgi:hypothetical protein
MVKMRADALAPHPFAQRELVPARLRKLMAELDLDAIGVLHAVEYPIKGKSGIWIVDGQHRWRALMDNGFGEWVVDVKIHLDVNDDARASKIFVRLNDRSPVNPFCKFKNRLRAGEEDAIGINDIMLAQGMKIGASTADGCISGIASLDSTR